ncbi:HNH endonuclease [Ramlibacter montanisoli]|uniref:HNH endonuclease 5 domain-containing protein n=1 Tax=Ramlibacter montanisoli TaxID=2732512 RepID=A0A849KE21_9BURK|nr:HNH endonuclease [Ramlibacter montanisoli]NNU44784.1 hypothetical protein [Ramlibacter montanisoli]
MLWKPATYGEHAFLRMYTVVAEDIEVGRRGGLDYLVSEERFRVFTKLAATLEVFYRSMRVAKQLAQDARHLESAALGKRLRSEVDLPAELCQDRAFLESALLAGRIIEDAKGIPVGLANGIYSEEASRCYICAIPLQKLHPNQRDHRSLDHLWPLSLGGESAEGNLMPACKDCNEKKRHMATWALAPIAAYHVADKGVTLPETWRIPLAWATLMKAAMNDGRLRTLKSAAKTAQPVAPNVPLEHRRGYVFMETMQMAGA